ncbi:hypothetical protein F7725_019777 [Dissostichus mawsoni]|uniref:Secreted protein n=1 Tax=Dissostichus mawsoni TaxID=36200 RepID=A0A7J5YP58_DISMA|nr:hypothetical protein F7725_019777 [Dissostichus mawsoni]
MYFLYARRALRVRCLLLQSIVSGAALPSPLSSRYVAQLVFHGPGQDTFPLKARSLCWVLGTVRAKCSCRAEPRTGSALTSLRREKCIPRREEGGLHASG